MLVAQGQSRPTADTVMPNGSSSPAVAATPVRSTSSADEAMAEVPEVSVVEMFALSGRRLGVLAGEEGNRVLVRDGDQPPVRYPTKLVRFEQQLNR